MIAAIATLFTVNFSGCEGFYRSNVENLSEPENPSAKSGAARLRGTRMSVMVGTIGT
jgi:hypothetical protein